MNNEFDIWCNTIKANEQNQTASLPHVKLILNTQDNTYMNAVLQCILSNQEFRNTIKEMKDSKKIKSSFLDQLYDVARAFDDINYSESIALDKFIEEFNKLQDTDKEGYFEKRRPGDYCGFYEDMMQIFDEFKAFSGLKFIYSPKCESSDSHNVQFEESPMNLIHLYQDTLKESVEKIMHFMPRKVCLARIGEDARCIRPLKQLKCQLKGLPQILAIENPFGMRLQNRFDSLYPLNDFEFDDTCVCTKQANQLVYDKKTSMETNIFKRKNYELFGLVLTKNYDDRVDSNYLALIKTDTDEWVLADTNMLIKNVNIKEHSEIAFKYAKRYFID